MTVSTPPPSILVVDDDDGIRALVVLALRRAGFDVLEAPNGEAGLAIARSFDVGLVVLDMGMPGMSGTEVVVALRGQPETATLPILLMTGSGDEYSVIRGLEAGADDFVPKPVRLDELVARVNAHLRNRAAWSHAVEDDLRARAAVVAALGQLPISSVPEEAAEAIIREITKRTDSAYVAVLQVAEGERLHELATFNRTAGAQRGGHSLPRATARHVLARARGGPWVDDVANVPPERTSSFAEADLDLAAGAPIYAGDDLVGILTIGVTRETDRSKVARRAHLLSATIDYATVLSAMAGSAFVDRRAVTELQERLRRVLSARQFHPAFQPIVDLETNVVVGYEALTRFDDGVAPDVRFAEAHGAGLGPEFELAAIRAAIDVGVHLPPNAFLSINVSPSILLRGDRDFRERVVQSKRPLVIELTEHLPIDDYAEVRNELATLGGVGLAIDDAGAGYSSLRHILELRPTYVKLDMSLVRGIDGDDLRQALAAGLQYFATKIGCRLIAEGIETAQEATTLRSLGIALGQGYFLGRPTVLDPPVTDR